VVDSVYDILALNADSIKPAPEMGTSVDADDVMGLGCAKAGEKQRVLILTDIEALMGRRDMELTGAVPTWAPAADS
jgi:purine-binding chemotaxis protein CheW